MSPARPAIDPEAAGAAATPLRTGLGRLAIAITIAFAVVVLVGLVAGAPDDTTDVTDPQHFGPRLVIVTVGLVVLVGLELLAFNSSRWWVRALALPVGLILALVLIALVEGAAGDPTRGLPRGNPLGLASDRLLVRVAPATALPVVGTETVTVVADGEVSTYALDGGVPTAVEARNLQHLTEVLDLEGAAGLGPGDRGMDSPLAERLAAVAPRSGGAPVLDPADLVVVVHGGAGPIVEIDVPSVAGGPLPDDTIDRLIDAAIALERLGYEVDLALPQGEVAVDETSSEWAQAWDDIMRSFADLRWLLLPVLVVMAALLLAGWLRTRGHRWVMAPLPADLDPAADPEAARTSLAAALDRALDELPLEGDPRSVVASAYLRMTAALAEHGVDRRPSDTPMEYLARALEQLDASSPAVHRLTDLLQLAMFSDRPVEPTMADEAISAFTQVRDELRSPAWV